MTIENYIVIAVGLAAAICGPLMVRHRVKTFRFFADTQRALGGAVGRAVAEGSSPFWIGVVGVGLTVIGLVAIGIGIFGREM